MNLLESKNISEWSYQRFAKFHNKLELEDENFQEKINKIFQLIVVEKVTDLDIIAKESGCTFEETIIKIKYLKNKRQIGDMYIDTVNHEIKFCNEEDKALLEKYTRFLYIDHLQVREIALKYPNTTSENINQVMNKIFSELKYLDSKGLINGVILNEVDQIIIYYSIEKHKMEKDLITIKCPTCGALNDINRGSKVRCVYCRTIVEAPIDFKIEHLKSEEKNIIQ